MKKITASAMAKTTINDARSTIFLLSLGQLPVLRVDDGDGSVDLVHLDLGALLDHHV